MCTRAYDRQAGHVRGCFYHVRHGGLRTVQSLRLRLHRFGRTQEQAGDKVSVDKGQGQWITRA